MNHVTEDRLLLLAWGELAEAERSETEQHLHSCDACAQLLRRLEEGQVALEMADPSPVRRSRRGAWVVVPLALAAGLGALMLFAPGGTTAARAAWQPHLVGSSTAGYLTGGSAIISIDSQLVQLEQGGTRVSLPD